MIKEFKEFVLRGNVVDLAVGILIGAAFGAIVTSLVKDVVTPLLGLINVPDFSKANVPVGDAKLYYGRFLNALISFVMIAAVVFFFVVKPVNHLMGLNKKDEEPSMRECPFCKTSIHKDATVCASCTRDVPATA